jgi:hypothetical protein
MISRTALKISPKTAPQNKEYQIQDFNMFFWREFKFLNQGLLNRRQTYVRFHCSLHHLSPEYLTGFFQ